MTAFYFLSSVLISAYAGLCLREIKQKHKMDWDQFGSVIFTFVITLSALISWHHLIK